MALRCVVGFLFGFYEIFHEVSTGGSEIVAVLAQNIRWMECSHRIRRVLRVREPMPAFFRRLEFPMNQSVSGRCTDTDNHCRLNQVQFCLQPLMIGFSLLHPRVTVPRVTVFGDAGAAFDDIC